MSRPTVQTGKRLPPGYTLTSYSDPRQCAGSRKVKHKRQSRDGGECAPGPVRIYRVGRA